MAYPTVITRSLLIALAIAGCAVTAFLVWKVVRRLDLSSDYRTTSCVITELTQDHGFVRYSFVYGGEEYSGFGKPQFRPEVGESVPVFFVPSRPSNSSLLEPSRPNLTDYTAPAIILAGSLLLAFIARSPSTMKWFFGREEGGKKKDGEPGATDNPDDAQRLREDH